MVSYATVKKAIGFNNHVGVTFWFISLSCNNGNS